MTTKYASDQAEEIEERDASNAVLRKYAYGPSIDDRIAMKDTAACTGTQNWCFYLTNWQGSTTTLINQSGTLNATYHYGPYGEGTNWTPSDALTGNPFRYTGRRVDPETGLYYYRARYYSPKWGRFLQTDPIGTKDDLNLYGYCTNDPINRVDSNGADSYAVARRLEVPVLGALGVGHGYDVSHARHIGDPLARIHSYGKLANGNMGNVEDTSGGRVSDLSATTAADDAADWISRAAGTTDNIARINAPDDLVAALAGDVSEGNPYSLMPDSAPSGPGIDSGAVLPAVNSSSASFAVADRATQIASGDSNARVDREPFKLLLPGKGASTQVGFRGTFNVSGRIDSRRNDLPKVEEKK